jgi:hypothetical protein
MSGRPGRLGAALHDSATAREFRSKLMGVPGLTVCGGRAGRRPRSSPGMHTAGLVVATSSSGCCAMTPEVEFRFFGASV